MNTKKGVIPGIVTLFLVLFSAFFLFSNTSVFPATAIACDPNDADCDGYLNDVDCDDTDPSVYPGAPELCDGLDNDCDGSVPPDEIDADGDGVLACADCDDANVSVYPGAPELCDGMDNDCDGSVPPDEIDADGDTYLACNDCDDANVSVYPGAPELCDGMDNDCDGSVPADEIDADGDGYVACSDDGSGWGGDPIFGYDDCDDSYAIVYPGAPELCDGFDNDCDGSVLPDEIDADGDGVLACDDCDDANVSVFPGAPELCDGMDNDCDGSVPAAEIDADDDGYVACSDDGSGWGGGPIFGYDDCDDTNVSVYPGAAEVCDGLDNDCDGSLLPDEIDADGDGVLACDDCDDADVSVYPGAPEICDGLDSDCDGTPDNDAEGVGEACGMDEGQCQKGLTVCAGGALVCQDAIWPGPELCDGLDNDCDGTPDNDAQGVGEACGMNVGECQEGLTACAGGALVCSGEIGPGPELCDGLDNDCDGSLLPNEVDDDGDGFLACDDCDDTDPTVNPGVAEIIGDAVDQDCDGSYACYPDSDDDGYRADDPNFILSADSLCGDDPGEASSTAPIDCDDADAAVHPGSVEIAGDGIDQDCDLSELCYLDADNDGFRPDGSATFPSADLDCDDAGEAWAIDPTGDCNDSNATIAPGLPEKCDGWDSNCDGIVPALETDSDGDGVLSCAEACPYDRLKLQPGICGCGKLDDANNDGVPDCDDPCDHDVDSDSDGISDCVDGCPDDSEKSDPGVCGCGNLDEDKDGDGVLDCDDACPDDAAKSEPGICGCGNPDDSNNDGVPDCQSECDHNIDTDQDGVPDCLDGCPDNPEKTEPGVCGCEIEDDANSNGIPDCQESTSPVDTPASGLLSDWTGLLMLLGGLGLVILIAWLAARYRSMRL